MAVNGSGIDAGKFSTSHPSADTLSSCHSEGGLSFESKPGVLPEESLHVPFRSAYVCSYPDCSAEGYSLCCNEKSADISFVQISC